MSITPEHNSQNVLLRVVDGTKFNSLYLLVLVILKHKRHTKGEKNLIKRSVCVTLSSHLCLASRPESYQQAMNNEKKLDSNPSVKFVFNADILGDTHL